MTPLSDTNITSPAFKADPYPFYARLREEAPVCRVRLPDKRDAWLIARHTDVAAALKDPRLVKDRRNAMSPEQLRRQPWVPTFAKPLLRNMLDVDGADHARLRALVHKAFTPRRVEQMRERVQALTDELLDTATREGRIDLIRQYALPLPTTVIAWMLGIPETDRLRFHRWTSRIVAAAGSRRTGLAALQSLLAIMRYLRRQITARRTDPRDDILTALVQAEDAGDRLDEDELLAMVFLLLIAGHETTVNLIGNGTLALLCHPDEMVRLRDDPGLIATAVEELLRYASPVETATERYAREDLEIAGVAIPRGGLVLAALASANRDHRQFPRPDTLDLTRHPNPHLAFGAGVHYCLGAPLARLEGQIAIATLLRRLPDLRLTAPPETLRWRPGLILRGLEALPVTAGQPSRRRVGARTP
ncbi:MAG: cytochrome P450 family protein [Egibacteraceae bacterium]